MTSARSDRPRRMIGLDVGQRRIGVAASEGQLAVPLTIIEHENRAADLDRIAAIAQEQEAHAIVVGLPVTMSGQEGEQARKTRRFGDALARRVDVPVIYHDERMSTLQVVGAAGGRVTGASAATRKRREKPRIDDLAAAVILQSYLDTLSPPRELPS
ncbi:MAG: Holliday junction resolvase RuvX [Dehalococcoidia bacterium]|nr:MAG: Holliday junction resolvase RuvX [Dehalococcoidia bacterium]